MPGRPRPWLRALMGSNMQRQAVPLLVTEAPLVATGLEERVARDSRAVIVADEPGKVASVTGNQIIITRDGKLPEGKKKLKQDPDKGIFVYPVRKFMRSNAATCINQKIVVKKGESVKKGQVIADGPCTQGGELALGRNVLVAFMPWNGYNFEDAILISERIVKEDIFTSIHIDEFEVSARDTKLGPEEITRDIPNLGDEALKNLGPDGVIRVGAEVKPGDIPAQNGDRGDFRRARRLRSGDHPGNSRHRRRHGLVPQVDEGRAQHCRRHPQDVLPRQRRRAIRERS